MMGIVSRTCTEIPLGDGDRNRKNPRPLEEFRSVSAYVLLGDPGAGKTTAFESECRALGDNACLVDAREFIALDLNSHPDWRGKTLFIDGLDEIRAGSSNVRTPFDEIRKRLDALGRPRFRLSCRTADWLGVNDRRRLNSVSPAVVTVLQLNPLTESEIVEILTIRQDIPDPSEFIQNAREHRVYGLLANPLTLKMLADAVGGGQHWPEGRKQTFETACRQMVQEHNEEHQAAVEPEGPPAPDRLLEAAGCLCAVQLLSGIAGYSIRSNEALDDYLPLDRCDYSSPELLRRALRTKLFKGDSVDRFVPIHRHIAEFLGARYVAGVVENRLPARRALALMVGEDGIVVTEMRGLSAWLAAHCADSRPDLIDRDPIGVGLYGDIREFSLDERRTLLKALNYEASQLGAAQIAVAFGALATPDMSGALIDVLAGSSRDDEHQVFVGFVLRVLLHGDQLSCLCGVLHGIVRDDTWWPGINSLALDAFVHCHDSPGKTSDLKVLLNDIWNGKVSDPDYQITGTLLDLLYPRVLSPSEVLDYVIVEGDLELFGRYSGFWNGGILDRSTDENVMELLDNLCRELPRLQPALGRPWFRRFPIELLARGLEAYSDELDTKRAYDWLGVAAFARSTDVARIGAWLDRHPNLQKKIILEGLQRFPGTGNIKHYAFRVTKRLCGALPADYGRWCLEQSIAMLESRPEVAEYLFHEAIYSHSHQWKNADLSLELLKKHANSNNVFTTRLNQYVSPLSRLPEDMKQTEKYEEEQRQEAKKWLDYVRSNESALRENRAPPALLHRMAEVYFGDVFNLYSGSGPEAIKNSLGGDLSLAGAVLQGLQGSIHRSDVPVVEEILALGKKGHIYLFSWPYLAGLAELERTTEESVSQWGDDRVRRALAFYFCSYVTDYKPNWFFHLLKARPKFVAEIQVQFTVSELRSDRELLEDLCKLRELAHDKQFIRVAQYATLPLLRAFPVRCKLKHIGALRHLLWAALHHVDRVLVRQLIERKLSRTSLNVAQRVTWLAAGVVVAPRIHEKPLNDYLSGKEGRIRHLADFFYRPPFSLDELEIPIVELMVRLVGRDVGPDDWMGPNGVVTSAKNYSDLVTNLIRRLATSSNETAGDILEALCSDPDLSRWRYVLSDARDAQRVIWRDARYRHPGIDQVCRTLNGGSPANAADLSALVVERLHEIGEQIRTSNTDDWRKYWNEDRYGRRDSPKHEESCRDAMLSDLRLRLPQGVDAQPEGQYAGDTRADIRVSCRDFQVPVEIKKNGHSDLWRAWRAQLIKQYTRDPATDGYGIYLVFWFGQHLTQRSQSGRRPANPQELREHLEETLTEDERRKISIKVIDVSGEL